MAEFAGHFDKDRQWNFPQTIVHHDPETIRKARVTVAAHAIDDQDLFRLLDTLGLLQTSEDG